MQISPELIELHDRYVVAINSAVAHDDAALVDELSAAYDDEARSLVAAAA